MRRGIVLRLIIALCCGVSLTSCDNVSQNATPPEAAIVDAADHDAFWLWAGVRPQPVLESAKTVYILDSELRRGDRLPTVLRPAIPAVGDTDIWIVVRVETLDWSEQVHASLQRRLRLWEQRNRLVGLQVDFDAATHGLDEYGAFLGDLRRRLPSRFRLGITGLMDWSANGDPAALAALSDSVDDIVIQTYQGRQTIPGYATYLKHLGRLDIPYRIGLVQHGQWAEPAGLRDDPDFRGYVVFLVNPR